MEPRAAQGELARCLELDPPLAYGLVGTGLEVRPVNALRLRATTGLATLRSSWPLAQAAGDWELEGDSTLALARARLAPAPLVAHCYQEYLERALVYSGRTDQVALWGPGSRASYELTVSPEGHVAPLNVSLPAQSYGMTVNGRGYLRCWSMFFPTPVSVARLPLEDPSSQWLQGYTQSHPDTATAWAELRERAGPEAVAAVEQSPFLAVAERRSALARLLTVPGLEIYARLRLARMGLEGDVRPALEQARQVLEQVGDCDEAVYLAACLELLDGQAPLATARLQALAQREPYRAQPWRLLVKMTASRGDLAGALAMARQFAERFPADPQPGYLVAELLSRLNRREEALDAVRGVLTQHPALVEALYLEARLLGRGGQMAAQRTVLERLLQLDPWPYRAQRLLAELSDRLGERDRAVTLYAQYLRSIEAALQERQEYLEASQRFRALSRP